MDWLMDSYSTAGLMDHQMVMLGGKFNNLNNVYLYNSKHWGELRDAKIST